MKKTAVYVRVSTKDQDTTLQREQITQYLKMRGISDYVLYEDKLSGATNNRPELKKLMQHIKEYRYERLVCWKLDRLFRSVKHIVNTLEELEHYGCKFICIRDNLDLESPSGRLMMHLIASFAEFEREIIRERIMAGIRNSKNKSGPPILHSGAKIAALRLAGHSFREIAKKVGCSVATAYRLGKVKKA